jgi:hypothetical protein
MVSIPEDVELPAFLESLPAALRVLRRSVEDALEYFWEERYRNRASEQAAALAQAAKLQGLVRVFALSRGLASICFITREEALPIRGEVAEKLRELLGLLDDACAESRRQAG